MADPKKILRETIDKYRKEKADEDKARQQKNDDDRNKILEGVGGDLTKSLQPVLEQLASNSQVNEEQIRNALKDAMEINMPPMDTESIAQAVRESVQEAFASLQFPAPNVNIAPPVVNVPPMNIPPTVFPEKMDVGLGNYSAKTPMPVMMVDTQGKPFVFSFPTSSGGKHDFFTIKGFTQSAFSELQNPDGRLKVELPAGASGLTDAELRATAVPVSQVSGANWSVSVSDVFGSVGSNVINPDNRIKVELPTGASGLTDAELRASAIPVSQISDAIWSTYVTGAAASTYAELLNPDGRVKVELPTGSSGLTDTELRATSLPVEQVSGSIWSTNVLTMPAVVVTSVTSTIAAMPINAAGLEYDSDNPQPVAFVSSQPVQQVSGAIFSTFVTGSSGTTVVVGPIVADAAANGDAPLKMGGIARTANPTAVSNSDMVSSTYDDLGRQIVRPLQVRDLIQTAYVSVTSGTETTLRAAVAGAYLDLIMIVGSNNSDAAVSIDIRPVTGGNIINTLRIPANGTAGWTPAVAWPQTDTGNNWTVDGPDETGRTLTFSALFSQEI